LASTALNTTECIENTFAKVRKQSMVDDANIQCRFDYM